MRGMHLNGREGALARRGTAPRTAAPRPAPPRAGVPRLVAPGGRAAPGPAPPAAAASRRRRAVACAASAAAAFPNPLGPLAAAAPALARAVAAAVDAHFLPFCLAAGIAAGLAYPPLGAAAARADISAFVTAGLFVIAGVQLRAAELKAALQAKGALVWGLASVLLLTPLLALPVLSLPLAPAGLPLGLAVFCCVPTALSSGITFTQAVGGNVAVALLLTVASNLLGVFTMPLLLPRLLGDALPAGAGLEALPLLARLATCVLLPTLLAAAARGVVPGLAAAVDDPKSKRALARLAAVLLAAVPWSQAAVAAEGGVSVSPAALAAAGVVGVGIHLAYLALNVVACRALSLGASTPTPAAALGVRRAVVLTASSKTLPVAAAVFASLAPALGPAAGVALAPAVMAHLTQIFIDSWLASRWVEEDAAAAAAARGRPAQE
ncbi:sodium metabolite cotransporter, chloroplastic-like [Raphidocelis subcapitata]|uniref:Sodium metabolite cotransporter, chloroplastic-like n=1 Tax=Raphidocelis subcapitata TaxID=307507 RepID=A0A2V0NX65_9CHLO|nr:sodium metabolite cotransporter, chloroplastic-like [Raphidocelis subcapitata]|eukprot:GBF92238.1 sodium metabolite cotransporter, chloroplastic-like [Raphidocelis subcapitata]